MKKLFTVSLLLLAVLVGLAQPITLTFTGRDASTGDYARLTSIAISDATIGWTDTLYYPDTVAVLYNVLGVAENAGNPVFGLSQNSPNPFSGTTDVMLAVAEPGTVTLYVTDVNGRAVGTTYSLFLQPGAHQFRILLANAGVYFLSARQNGQSSTVKMVNNGHGPKNGIDYVGTLAPAHPAPAQKSAARGQIDHLFFSGDGMTFKGFGERNGETVVSELIERRVDADETIVLELDTIPEIVITDGRPCPGTPFLTDVDGNLYNTVQIGTQCWMKESLKVTRFPDSTAIALGSGESSYIGYRYYPEGDSNWVALGGYQYNWIAVMHGYAFAEAVPDTVQGICPDGWHVPSHYEWVKLENYVRSQSEYWCNGNFRSTGKAMADSIGWLPDETPCTAGCDPGSNNATGFSAYPIGMYAGGPYHTHPGEGAIFWCSTASGTGEAYSHMLILESTEWGACPNRKESGYAVRCVRNGAIEN